MTVDASFLERYWAAVPNIEIHCWSKSDLFLPILSLSCMRYLYCLPDRRFPLFDEWSPDPLPLLWPWPLPEDLVHPVFFVIYADKRARHDEMVSLDERYEDLLVRYGKSEHSRAAIHRGWEHSKTIERVLSAQLEFPLHESTVVGGRLVSRA